MLGHFGPRILGGFAPLGVEMFFILSGRLMAEVLIVRRQALSTFVVRRASRILPLVLLYSLVVGVGLGLAQLLAGTVVNWLSPLASLLFFSNYLANPEPLLEHTWSLAVEEHSYLLLVLVAWLSARKPTIAGLLSFAIAGCMVLNGAFLFHGGEKTVPYVFWRSDVRSASVLLSFALFLLLQRWRPSPRAMSAWLSPICLLAAGLSMFATYPVTPLTMTACTFFAAISVNTIEFAAPAYRRLLSTNVLTWLGMLSFSIYIWQQPFFMATKGGIPSILALPLTLACAIWSYLRVETPARRFLNRRWDERRDAKSPVGLTAS